MLNKVHHVTYVVENIAEMSNYLEKSFGIKPISTDEFPGQGFKSILFRIGETLVDFFEPLSEETTMARQLKATGPGVMHVAWGVDNIDQVFKISKTAATPCAETDQLSAHLDTRLLISKLKVPWVFTSNWPRANRRKFTCPTAMVGPIRNIYLSSKIHI